MRSHSLAIKPGNLKFKSGLVSGLLLACFLLAATPSTLASSTTIALSPEEGPAGISVTVDGSGFQPLAEVSIQVGEDYVSTSPNTIFADDLGEFTAQFDVPHSISAGSKTVTATDDASTPSSAFSQFTIINTAPVAGSQHISIPENSSVPVSLTASDINDDTLTFSIIEDPSHGTLSDFDPDSGEVLFTAEIGYNGQDSFSFRANDGEQDSNAGTVSIIIDEDGGENNPPIAEDQSVEVDEDTPAELSLEASDTEGDDLIFTVVDLPNHGTLSGSPPSLVYTPSADYAGVDNFTFNADDGTSVSATGLISIVVAAVNDPPTTTDIDVSTDEDDSILITLTAIDIDSPSASFDVVANPLHGDLGGMTATGPYSANISYAPDSNYNGLDSFTFTAYDGVANSIVRSANITIASVNDSPVAFSKSVKVDVNSQKTIMLGASDADGDSLSYAIVLDPTYGTLTGVPPNISYRPFEDYIGHDSFMFLVSDALEDGNIATVSINVESPEDDDTEEYYDEDYYEEDHYGYGYNPPIANSQAILGVEDIPINVTLSATDADDDYLTFVIIDYPLHGNLSGFDAENGTLVYSPSTDYSGPDSFTFGASDNYEDSETAKVSILITPVNDAPQAIGQTVNVIEKATKITLTAFDPDNDSLEYTILSEPVHGTLSGNVPHLVYHLADPDFTGEDSFTFNVNDGKLYSNIAVVVITTKDPAEVPETTDLTPSGNETADEGSDDPSEDEDYSSSGTSSDHANSGNDQSSTRLHVEKGNMIIQLSWEHDAQQPIPESTLNLQFTDRMTRVPLASHIWYDLMILDSDNNEILTKHDLVALNSADVQKISFPANGTYHFEVNVKGLIDISDNSVSQDSGYTGKAFGIVVVPEFNSAWLMIMISIIMGFAMITIRLGKNGKKYP